MNKALKIIGSIVVGLALLLLGVVYAFGPTYGAMFAGKPIFLTKPSPERYAKSVLGVSEAMGIYGDSEEFKVAKQEALEQAKSAKTTTDTHDALNKAVKKAGGKHSRLIPPEENGPSTEENTEMPSATREGSYVTLKVPEVGRGDVGQKYAETGAKALVKEIDAGACGAIIDLRNNGGGDMGPMIAAVSPVLPDGVILSFVSRMASTDVVLEGNSVKGGGSPTSAGEVGKRQVPVAVLVDANTASSAEATMLAFRGLDSARSFGTPTAGYASANMMYDYPDGAGLMLTTAKDKARTGEEFAEDPIQPDEVLGSADDAPKAAKEWLASRGCV